MVLRFKLQKIKKMYHSKCNHQFTVGSLILIKFLILLLDSFLLINHFIHLKFKNIKNEKFNYTFRFN